MNREITINSIWRHFKGIHHARVLALSEHTETGEKLVTYICYEYGIKHCICSRPIEMFLSEVDRNKYPDAKQEYRFEKIIDGDNEYKV